MAKNLDIVAKAFPFQYGNPSAMQERARNTKGREKAARALAEIAVALGAEGIDPAKVAH
jgi:hypothetical protein